MAVYIGTTFFLVVCRKEGTMSREGDSLKTDEQEERNNRVVATGTNQWYIYPRPDCQISYIRQGRGSDLWRWHKDRGRRVQTIACVPVITRRLSAY